MLAKSAARGIYRRLIRADLTLPIDLPDASYDAMVSSGTFTHGHVGPEPLGGLMGLLRRGGHFAFTVHQDILTGHGFEAEVARLQRAGILDVVERRLDRFFAPLDPVGLFVVARRP